ncbi:DnaD domain protein [Anaerobacillus sp. MEB173]|uniref:DnaD domain protein n=1 Tax=Anaerobacillus sp. MEB173 TaxID=3383345 RepID=UPI003F8E1DC0
MNYLKELNAFYDRLETNPLSTSAVALWHALMHINNKTGWRDQFAVAITALSTKTGLSDRTISKARKELKEKGYITFSSQSGNQPAIYQLCSLVLQYHSTQTELQKEVSFLSEPDIKPANHDENCFSKYSETTNENLDAKSYHEEISDKHTDNCTGKRSGLNNESKASDPQPEKNSDKHADNRSGKRAALNKRNEMKLNETSKSLTLYKTFEKSFNIIPTPLQIDLVASFIDQDGLSEELVIYGLSIAGEKGKPFSYAKSILTNWSKQNIRTVEQAKKESENYQSRKSTFKKFPTIGGNRDGYDSKRNEVNDVHVANFKFYK